MKTKLIKTLVLAATFATAAVAYAGDIYDIRPCDEYGLTDGVTSPVATLAKPVGAGTNFYFRVRLQNQTDSSSDYVPWTLTHLGTGSEAVDGLITSSLPNLGVYVSGRLVWASFKNYVVAGTNGEYTDLIYEYLTKNGDFALPMLLATASGPASDNGSGGSYIFNDYLLPAASRKWAITRADDPSVEVDMSFYTGAPGLGRTMDYSLSKAGFYVQTIDFDSRTESEDGTIWRYVHEGSNITSNYTPKVVMKAAAEQQRTVYVWSKNDGAVRVNTTTQRLIADPTDDSGATSNLTYVAELVFEAGEVEKELPLWGVAEGGEAELVLSAYLGYRYSDEQSRFLVGPDEADFVTVKVKCVEPMPPTVMVVADVDTMTADGDSELNAGATLSVYLTQPISTALDVTVTPQIGGAAVTDRVMLSDSAKTVKTVASLAETVTVTLPAGSSGIGTAKNIYVFALKGGAPVDFVPTYDDNPEITTSPSAEAIDIVAANPVIVSPTAGSEIGATAGVDREIEIEVADTYADRQIASPETGYKIEVKYNDSLGWKELAGTYYIGSGNLLRDAGNKLPVLNYPTSSTGTSSGTFNTSIRITEPINQNKTTVTLVATVEAPKTVTVSSEAAAYDEGGSGTFTITLSGANDTGNSLYAYLVAVNDLATKDKFAAQGFSFIVTSDMDDAEKSATTGLEIVKDQQEITGDVKFLDGGYGGSTYYFKVVLCTTPSYDQSAIVTGYNSNTAKVTVNNVEPSIVRVELNDEEPGSDGRYPSIYPAGIAQKLQAVVTDPGQYDLDATTASDLFRTRWNVKRAGGAADIFEITGNPNSVSTNYPFRAAGEYTITVQVRDKDMSDWSAAKSETFVTIISQPQLTVTLPSGSESTSESIFETTRQAQIFVGLGGYFAAEEPIVVSVTVSPNFTSTANPGKLLLDSSLKTAPTGYEAYEADNAYFLTFDSADPLPIAIDEMDGTDDSAAKGYLIVAEVLNGTPSTDTSKTWAEYYLKNKRTILYIENEEPVTTGFSMQDGTNTWSATQPIHWSVRSDVASDFTTAWGPNSESGVLVTIDGAISNPTNFYLTEAASGNFLPDFGTRQGRLEVRATVADKDSTAAQEWTYVYVIPAVKFLKTASVGPASGNGSIDVSKLYAKAKGLGEGYVTVNDCKTEDATNYLIDWNCSTKGEVMVFGYGFKLGQKDPELDTDGKLQKKSSGDFYSYSDVKLDSFFYAWVLPSAAGNGAASYASSVSPKIGFGGPVPYTTVKLPTATQQGSENYDDTYMEAVFAKEWRAADNMGDINGDGVPDYLALREWESGAQLVVDDHAGGELGTVNTRNDDGDYLPSAEQLVKTVLVPGNLDDWSKGISFNAQYELRGYHDGLNYGMFPVTDSDGWISDLDLSVAEKLALVRHATENVGTAVADDLLATYTVGAEEDWLTTDEQQTRAKAYISWTWRNYTAGNASTWGFTVENRTDPTVRDTDGDGMDDGYEYYFWYAATVGFDAAGTQIVGEKFNLEDIEEPLPITSAEIAAIFNPNARPGSEDYWQKQDTDGDGLFDWEEMLAGTSPIRWDTDGDGVSDLFELMWNIDPLDNGKDKNADYNGDGDFIAFVEGYKYYPIVSFTEEPGTYYARSGIATNYVENGTNFTLSTGFKAVRFNGAWIPAESQFTEEIEMAELPYLQWRDLATDDSNYSSVDVAAKIDLYHQQVYSRLGFDPRTGWYKPEKDTGNEYPNTKAFTSRDEMLLLKYRYVTGLRALYYKNANEPGDLQNLADEKISLAKIFKDGATNPSAAFEDKTYGAYQVKGGTDHGADTDGDAVPDGWELYVGADPNVKDTPTKRTVSTKLGRLDKEYAGTTSCGVYADCPTIYANRPKADGSCIKGWLNKFWPVDPLNTDTDGDGITDLLESRASWSETIQFGRWGQTKYSNVPRGGASVVVNHIVQYGPLNDGVKDEDDIRPSLRGCYAGGGYNPCSIDTDKDGLPDQWEREYGGVLFYDENVYSNAFTAGSGIPIDEYDDEFRASIAAFHVPSSRWKFYTAMGMDPTVADSTFDYDFDGLANWQEYMVQALRHLRYDDAVTPLNGYDMHTVDPATDELKPGNFTGKYLKPALAEPFTEAALDLLRDRFGYTNFVNFVRSEDGEDYLLGLGYFAEPTYEWDPANEINSSPTVSGAALGVESVKSGYKYMRKPCAVKLGAADDYHYADTNEAGSVIWKGYKQTVAYDPVLGPTYADEGPEMVFTNEVGSIDGYDIQMIESSRVGFGVYTNALVLATNGESIVTAFYKVSTTAANEPITGVGWFFATSFVSTDPRLWDTDEDGMDDYWELFHGLNPILGNITDGVDIIRDAYDNDISATRNAHTGWQDVLAEPVYDPIKLPWLVGSPTCDADGDGLRNAEEALLVNLTQPSTTHTDPTPLWMTDTTAPSEVVPAEVVVEKEEITPIPYDIGGSMIWIPYTHTVQRPETNGWVTVYQSPSYTAQYYEIPWTNNTNWAQSGFFLNFEENEGYDTDGDWRADRTETIGGVESTSDPLDYNDLQRRQSIAFGSDGQEGVVISYSPITRDGDVANADFLKHFSVEAWVRPNTAASGSRQYVVSRAINKSGWDLLNRQAVIRHNFAIGIAADGKAFVEFDDSTDGAATVEGPVLADEKWVHLAATYDGAILRLFIDGKLFAEEPAALNPANGVTSILQDPGRDDYEAFPVARFATDPSVMVIGGRAFGNGAFGAAAAAAATSWSDVATDFFKGSVDEVRVWNGARSEVQIKADFKSRYTTAQVKALRQASYQDSSAVELVHHYNFAGLAGATEANYVQKVPAGFATNVLAVVNADVGVDAVKIGWWNAIVTNSVFAGSQVYGSGHVVPWIRDTVGHLPRLIGEVADSEFWSEYLAGYTPVTYHGIAQYAFPNSMNPYVLVSSAGVLVGNTYSRYHSSNYTDNSLWAKLRAYGNYDSSHSFRGARDLLPLGDVYAKRLADSWDGDGPEDAWAITTDGTSDDGDLDDTGIPQWAKDAGYTTAGTYARALAMGARPGVTTPGADDPFNTLKQDVDGNGIPDWWEATYGVRGKAANEDPDKDGLSTYSEWLISEGAGFGQGAGVDGWASLNPNLPRSGDNQEVRDYFLAGGAGKENYYLGEIVGDHDFIEDWWEVKYPNSYASISMYDPADDRDGDGWSNFAEARASMWTGGYLAGLVDRYLGGNSYSHEGSHPKPSIGVRVSYNGIQNVTATPLVMRTYTDRSSRVDATFVARNAETVDAGNVDNIANVQILGTCVGDTTFRGHLHPGRIIPGTQTYFEYRALDAEPVYYWHCEGCQGLFDSDVYGSWAGGYDFYGTYAQYRNHLSLHSGAVSLTRTVENFTVFAQSSSDADGRTGVIATIATSNSVASVVGTIDFLTGEYSLDLAKVREAKWDLSASVLRANYTYHIGDEWPQELWMSEPTTGRVKEGKNTIEVFFDLNNSGTWDAGEPLGIAQGVEVGWAQTSLLDIELTDTSAIVPRVDLASLSSDRTVIRGAAGQVTLASNDEGSESGTETAEGLTATYRIVRTKINEIEVNTPLISKSYVLDDRAYLHEGDVLTAKSCGLDWSTLVPSAVRVGIAANDIQSATYAIEEMTKDSSGRIATTNLMTFVNTFAKTRAAVSPVERLQGGIYHSATPTFYWTADDETVTAFKLQVWNGNDEKVYDSGIRRLPARVGGVYGFTPDDLFIGYTATNGMATVFEDHANYTWKVALLNAKFNDIADDAAEGWSAAAEFRMEVESLDGTPTGYGSVAATVRYYGPAPLTDITNQLIVAAYTTPDFTGVPLAMTRVTDLTLLADRADLFKADSTNAVMRGIEPGNVYLMAFIDRNNNGRRDAFESWGYANHVDEVTEFLYSPKPVQVAASVKIPSAVIYLEDTDVNKNGTPDALEDLADLETSVSQGDGDTDGDGLSDVDERSLYGTDPALWDTDGDGLPDGWEIKFAGTDPLSADADTAVDGDVMAYAELPGVRVTFSDGTRLLVKENSARPQVGDLASDYNYRSLYLYGAAESTARNLQEATASALYGTGTNILGSALAAGLRITAVEDVTVVLVHAQVYGNFGFDPLTANPAVEESARVNTKAFTALDKYLVARYLESMGLTVEATMNANGTWADSTLAPNDADNNKDGIPDGWELYVMFGSAVVDDPSAANAKISPWAADAAYVRAAANTPDGQNELTILQKYDRGNTPLDPWVGDTNGDGISDANAYRYHLKTAVDQLMDEDGDGLSNWAEYLAQQLVESKGIPGVTFRVDDPYSVDPNRLDYFYQVEQEINGTTYKLYIGEALDKDGIGLVADHDFVDDGWEDGFTTMAVDGGRYANRYVWDALRDADNDGWSNFAEVRSGTRPDSVATLGIENMTLKEYPVPMINLTVGYNGSAKMGDMPIILKAWSNAGMSGLPDAIWTTRQTESVADATVDSTNTAVVGTSNSRYLGVWQNRQLKLYLSPGNITPSTIAFKFKDISYTAQSRRSGYLRASSVGTAASAEWITLVSDIVRTDDPTMGDLYLNYKDAPTEIPYYSYYSALYGDDYVGSTEVDAADGTYLGYNTIIKDGESHKVLVGSVNYATGEVTIDFSMISEKHYQIVKSWYDDTILMTEAQLIDPTVSYITVEYAGAVPEQTFPAKFYLSTAEDPGSESLGHVREGANTFIAFADLNGNGDFDEGEPFGYAKDVNVGWDQVPELYIELTDAPATASRFTIGAQDEASSYVRVMRTAINGKTITPRAVYSKSINLTNGRVFSEADFIAEGEYDFDWKSLVADAKAKLDIEAADIASADYAVYVGWGNTEPVYTFTRTFTMSSVKPVITGAYGDEGYTIHSARPSLQWISTERSVAFVVQIDDDNDFSSPVLTATNLIFSATENGYVFKPDAYIGQELEDDKSYFWRVATINAKSREKALDDLDWSNTAEFRTAIDSTNANTGYGKLAVEVRYFGPSTKTLGDVVVGVYPAADFACDPIARKRLTGDDSVATLVNDPTKSFNEITANVTFDGIAPGDYYVMAFIDTNNDGKRQPYETWGYANRVAECVPDLWSPVAIAVTETKTARPSAMLVMEDTDVNQNNVPDCLEDMTGWMDSASGSLDPDGDPDGDGLTNDEEQNDFGTDPLAWDTDGDGMPDGWEAKFAETDPLAQDGDFVGMGDVMAYVVTNLHLAVTKNAAGEVDARYVILPGETDTFYTTFDYNGSLAMGAPAVVNAANIFAEQEMEIIVIHGGVYDLFGFDPATANPAAATNEWVNTKPFTALDKYLVVRYLESFGFATEADMNKNGTWAAATLRPGYYDSDANGLPDGWELYMNFATDNAYAKEFPSNADSVAKLKAAFAAAGELIRNPYDDEYFWKQLDDAVRAKVPVFTNDEAFKLGFVTADGLEANSEDFWSAAQTDDYCAYVETNCLIAVVTDAVTGDQTTYAIRPGSEDLYTTIDVNGQLYVGKYDANATLTAGEFQTIVTNMVVMHAAVYDWYGWNVTTARPAYLVPQSDSDESDETEPTASTDGAGANSVPFTRLLKFITQKLYLAEMGAQGDYSLCSETDNPDWWTDTNGNDLPDGWELYVKYAQNADPTLTDDDYKEAFDDGADPNADDTDGDGIPDDAEREMGSDPIVDDADQHLEGDVMAYAELKDQTIFTATDGATTKAYVVLKSDDGARAVQVGDEITDNWTVDHTFATVFEYGNTNAWVYGVGAAAAPAAGTPWTVTGVTNATVALVHAQVYDYYGFNPKTANPSVSSNEWASVHSKAFTYLDKYLVKRWLEAEGVTDAAAAVLDVTTADTNGDGIADGWELYTMFGPAGATETLDAAKISPWKTPDYVRDYANTPDGGRLTILDEYEGGTWPTDPWSIDTDGDGVFDVYAYLYHLKGDQAGLDNDGDGLSNYAEYLVSEVFQIVALDPNQAMTDGSTLDYYRKFGELYLGEVFTDHDRVADLWEALYESGTLDGIDYAARGIYDPDADRDGDGWSNYAEYRAGTSPARQMSTGIDDYTLIEHPVPVVEMEIVYNGTADIEGRTLTVSAWNETDDAAALKAPTATWTVTTANETATESGKANATTGESVETKYLGQMPTGTRTYYLGSGAVKEGSFKLSFKDKNYVEGQVVELLGQRYFQPTGYGDSDTALWFYDVIDQSGKLVTRGGIFAEAHEVGTIDYDTGRVTIDFDDKEFTAELFVGDPAEAGGSKNNSGTTTYHGLNPPTSYVLLSWSPAVSVPVKGRHYLSDATTGFLREGLTTFTVEAAASTTDVDQNSTSTANAGLFGVVRHVDVGWAGAKFTVELTDFSPVTPRIDLWTGTPDRSDAVPLNDPRINNESNVLETVSAEGSLARVRVVRYAINGYPIDATWGAGLVDVVYENSFNATGRTKLTELDFLGEGMFDVDWTDSFTEKVASASGTTRGTDGAAGNLAQVLGEGSSITNIQYLVVIGDGSATWERGGTNVVNALSTQITRRFDRERATPVAVAVDGLQYAARPTFKWRMEGEEALVSRFGSSYTAFRLQVKNAAGTVIYDSGICRAPATDADGNFTWTAPICAGSLLKEGLLYDTAGSYSWQVSMYNAKFRSDSWSAPNGASVFATAVNEQQEVNDHGYSSIKAAVKYAGPSIVLSKVADLATAKGKVIVQAFTTPDFSGEPLAQGLATDDVADTMLATANAQLKGLAAIGTYYVRAFIDMDGDGELGDWEPWGYVKDAVTLVNDGTISKAPLVAVWIEDSDSDGDWVPDAYEYAASGWETAWETLKGNRRTAATRATTLIGEGGIVLKIATDNLTGAGISKGLPGASFTAMQSEKFVLALLGYTNLDNKTTLEAIAEVTRGKLVPNSVRVVAITLEPDGSAVNLTVNADVASGISGTVVSQYYEFTGSDTVQVLVKVWKKDSLEDATWSVVYTTPEPVTITPQTNETVVVPFDTQLDLKSGFFKVELVEVVTP